MIRLIRAAFIYVACAIAAQAALAQQPLRIGIVTFLSGPAAGPFGVPARNGFELVAELMNAGSVPAPHAGKGFGGRAIELVVVDEAGGPQKQVAEFRNLAQRADLVVGYISSGDCLAIAPVAEELKKLTVLFDCGTPRFSRTPPTSTCSGPGLSGAMDNVAAALYALERHPNIRSIAGINQNYAWGQDSWTDFEAAMKALKPGIEVKTSLMTKLFAGQFGAEISTLLSSGADLVHSSFWGADLEGLVLQARRAGFSRSTSCCSRPASRPSTASAHGSRTARSSARAVRSVRSRRTASSTAGSGRRSRTAMACRPTMPRTRRRTRCLA